MISMNVTQILTTAISMPIVATPKDHSIALAKQDTLEMELFARTSTSVHQRV